MLFKQTQKEAGERVAVSSHSQHLAVTVIMVKFSNIFFSYSDLYGILHNICGST